jgi:formylglycine-generating enzyme
MRTALLVLAAALLAGCSAGGDDTASIEGTAITRACPPPPAQAWAWVPGGRFTIGEEAHLAEEGPPREVEVAGFWMATREVTNAEFAAFVAATGYRTMAERDPPILEGAPPEMRLPGSAVFTVPGANDPRWWRWVPGANWRNPEGPGSSIAGREREPVVQIAYDDALAFARWAGKSLPSEEQWELAAATGGASRREPVTADGTPTANYWQGVFPARNLGLDGFRGRAPTGCFPADRHGIHDLIGNVWEWTASARDPGSNVIKGGSFLCASNYCARYRPAARQFQERGLGTDHIGIRLIDTERPPPVSARG